MKRLILRSLVAAAALAATLTVVAPVWAGPPGENGRILFSSNRAGGPPELYTSDLAALDVRRLTWNAVADRQPRFSPNGEQIVVARTVVGADQDIWIMNVDGSGERQLTSGSVRDDAPVFTHDGRSVVFQRVAGVQQCPCELRIIGVDGSGERVLDTGAGNAVNPDVSAHGRLVFASDRDDTLSIYVSNLKGGSVRRVTDGPAGFGDFRPRWSPKGNELVFIRGDGQVNDIYTVQASGERLRQLTSGPRFEEQAQWSPDGEQIVFGVFEPTTSRLHTIDAEDGSNDRTLPQVGAIRDSFDGPGLDTGTWWSYLNGTGGALDVTGGRAELSLSPDAADDPARGFMGPNFGSQCRAVGDYEASVRYELLDWPFSNGVHVLLGDAGLTGSIGRRSESGFEDYLAFFNPTPASALTNDLEGRLRLTRTGSVLTASYASGATWTPLLSGPTSSEPASLNVHLFSFDAIFGNQFVRVAYDDFGIDAGSFECPSWWREGGADWQALGG